MSVLKHCGYLAGFVVLLVVMASPAIAGTTVVFDLRPGEDFGAAGNKYGSTSSYDEPAELANGISATVSGLTLTLTAVTMIPETSNNWPSTINEPIPGGTVDTSSAYWGTVVIWKKEEQDDPNKDYGAGVQGWKLTDGDTKFADPLKIDGSKEIEGGGKHADQALVMTFSQAISTETSVIVYFDKLKADDEPYIYLGSPLSTYSLDPSVIWNNVTKIDGEAYWLDLSLLDDTDWNGTKPASFTQIAFRNNDHGIYISKIEVSVPEPGLLTLLMTYLGSGLLALAGIRFWNKRSTK